MRLLDSLKKLVTEAASLGDVQDSIKKKKIIVIYYDGNDNGGKGYRTIEPLCLEKKIKETFYQVGGYLD